MSATNVYEFSARTIHGVDQPLADFKGKVLLIVNVASECGFTPQYEGLEQLHRRFQDRGFAVLGFPCNQFGGQEPGSEAQIKSFCETRFGVSFPLFAKIEVNGPNTHPLYDFLKAAEPGILGTQAIKWNFTKFLVGRDGSVLKRYAPGTKPEAIAGDIEAALAQ
jgi:glutathione peroxidase